MKKEHSVHKYSSDEVSKETEILPKDLKKIVQENKIYEAKSRIAYFEFLEKAAIFRDQLECLSEKENIEIGKIDKHLLKGFLSYVSRLYSTGEISESAYISLVTQAAESYAERLIDMRVKKALQKYEDYFEKASLKWFL